MKFGQILLLLTIFLAVLATTAAMARNGVIDTKKYIAWVYWLSILCLSTICTSSLIAAVINITM